MSVPTPIYRLTDTAFRALANEAENRPELWQDPNTDFAQVLAENRITEYWQPTGVTARVPIRLEPPAGNRRPLADQQALTFHKNLEGMTPAKASDPNLLAWLNHFTLHGFGIARWPLTASTTPTNNINRHWLSESNSEWKHLKTSDPKSFADAVFVDRALRELPNLRALSKGAAYLHRSRQPLEDIDSPNTKDYFEAMQEERAGLCGI